MSTEMQAKVQASPAQNFIPTQTGLLQRKSALYNTPGLVEDSGRDKEKLTLQRNLVDQAGTTTVPRFGHDFCRVSVHSTGPGMIQAKLKINEPGDPYEEEADRVADAVMRMEEPGVQRQPEEEEEEEREKLPIQAKTITPIQTLPLQHQDDEEEGGGELKKKKKEEEKETFQAKEIHSTVPKVTPNIESRIHALKEGGQPLPKSARAYFEPRFGYDFNQVQVHTDVEANTLNRALNARAFTAGQDIFFRHGAYNLGSRQGRELLAHELTHVVQQNRQALKVQRFTEAICIQRDNEPSTITPEDEDDYRSLVEDVIRLFEAIVEINYLTTSPSRSRAGGGAAETLQKIEGIQASLTASYDNAQRIIENNLSDDDDYLKEQLRYNYQAVVETLHRSTGDCPRVNFILIAAPSEAVDKRLKNATDYALSYFKNPPEGDEVVVIENIASLSDLFDPVEKRHPERMIRRIDIFAHGNIEPTEIKFGAKWYTTEEIQIEAETRQYKSSYIQSVSRFDGSSLIEVHACRLGRGEEGKEFLTVLGRSIGGTHGQEVVGYKRRWVPRRFTVKRSGIPIGNTQKDIWRDEEPQDIQNIDAFEVRAVRVFDNVVAGSIEVQKYLNEAEKDGGEVTRERKIKIMRDMYDENECWLIRYMYKGAYPTLQYPEKGVDKKEYTFTSEEEEWSEHTVSVRIEPPS